MMSREEWEEYAVKWMDKPIKRQNMARAMKRFLIQWVVGTILVPWGIKLRKRLVQIIDERPSTMEWWG